MSKHYVIVGGGIASLSALSALRAAAPNEQITIVAAEPHFAYSKVLLTHLIAHHIQEKDLFLTSMEFYRQSGVNLHLGTKVDYLDPDRKTVQLSDGTLLKYDQLLIASGGSPTLNGNFPSDTPDIRGLRTLEDARFIQERAWHGAQVVIWGGGLVGVKLACALNEVGYQVQMVVTSSIVLSQVADEEAGRIISTRMQERGIGLFTKNDISRVLVGKTGLESVVLTDGRTLSGQVLVVAKGVRPNLDFLPLEWRTGRALPVDNQMRTKLPNVFAAGDVAAAFEITRQENRSVAIWPHAVEQGRVAALNMADRPVRFRGSLTRNALEILGMPFISMGIVRPLSINNWDVDIHKGAGFYRKLVYRDGKLMGAILLGRVEEAGKLQALIRRQNPVPWSG
ncbi:MAG: NAD(P)/FAD-dependent oxidoreductase [Desulfitobacteriaceae bacterium]